MKITTILGINGYKSKDDKLPIYIRVNIGLKRKLISIGVKIKKSEWDHKNKRVKLEHPNASAINLKIIELLSSIEKNYINGNNIEVGNKDDFFWWFNQRLEYSKKKHSTYNYEKLRAVRDKLFKFSPNLQVKKLDYKFILDYEQHLIEIGNSKNTIADNMMRIKIIMNMIVRTGNIEYHKNPFLNYKFSKTRVIKKRASFDKIKILKDYDFISNEVLQLSVDMYVFSFYCAGIRFGDLCRIEKSMIKENRLRYNIHKTNIERSIKLMNEALIIINKYKSNEKYLFDTKVKWSSDKSIEDKSISSRNAFHNKKLKMACDLLGIEELSFHTSRNSFADYAKKSNIDIHTLKDLFGHSKTSTTETYMKDFYETETDNAMDKLFG